MSFFSDAEAGEFKSRGAVCDMPPERRVTVKIENHDVLPVQTAYLTFETADGLLAFLHDSRILRHFQVTTVGRPENQMWVICIEAFGGYLEMCREGGMCGICVAVLDPDGEYPRRPDPIRADTVYCAYCARPVAKRKRSSLVDLFYEHTKKAVPERVTEPIPGLCGECGGAGGVPICDDWGEETGESAICPECAGTGEVRVPRNLLML